MRTVPNVRLSLVAAAWLVAGALSTWASPAKAENPAILFDPPKLDYKAVCKPQTAERPPLTRDWTTWDGKGLKLSVKEAVALAVEYTSGSERVQRSPATALKILNAAELTYPAQRLTLQLPIARALQRSAVGSDTLKEAEQRLVDAYERGVIRAAFALGQFYGDGGPSEMHDLEKSRHYYEKSALSSDPDGLIEYARIITADQNSTEDFKRVVVTNALVGLIGQLKHGDCSALSRIGFLYLRGNIVDKEINTALKWLEAFAKTGDTKTALNLSQLYSSNQVDQIDIEKSMTYLLQAADGGVASAQFTMGKAYATGISVVADRAKAISYLEAAARQGIAEADEWLARLYAGEFGGEADTARAHTYFQKALQNEKIATEVSVTYGKFLARYGASEGQLDKTIAMLQKAADAGSVDATNTLGRIYLDLGNKDSKNYLKAMRYFTAAAKYGNSDAAAKLSEMFACGRGVPISISISNSWRQKAAMYGSVYSVLASGLNLLESSDPQQKAKGRNYLIQAAFKGNPDAIGFVVARWEKGVDGFETNPAAAARLMNFVEKNRDTNVRAAASIAVIRNRFDVASSEKEKSEQIDALASYIQKDDTSALVAESEMLDRAGKSNDQRQMEINKLLAEKGEPRGMRDYGRLLLANPDVDIAVGRSWLEKARDAGDLKARLLLIDPADINAAKDLADIASSGEICKIDDMVSIAQAYSSLPDPNAKGLAKYWLNLARSVVGRNGDDLYAIGAAYLAGVGGTEGIADAEDLYLRALELGRKSVLRDLAEGHLQRRWRDPSPEKAKAYLLELYELGDKEAANKFVQEVADGTITSDVRQVDEIASYLGRDLKSPGKVLLKLARMNSQGGLGVADPQTYIKWLTISAADGEPNSMYRLYQAYFFGTGVAKDVPLALRWLEKSAEGGRAQAMKEIAVAYRVGLEGFPKNAEKAEYWDKKLKELPVEE